MPCDNSVFVLNMYRIVQKINRHFSTSIKSKLHNLYHIIIGITGQLINETFISTADCKNIVARTTLVFLVNGNVEFCVFELVTTRSSYFSATQF